MQARGQTYYNFAMGGVTYSTSHSIIRCIDSQRAIAYYENPSNTIQKLALINIYGNVIETKLGDYGYVTDSMRVSALQLSSPMAVTPLYRQWTVNTTLDNSSQITSTTMIPDCITNKLEQ